MRILLFLLATSIFIATACEKTTLPKEVIDPLPPKDTTTKVTDTTKKVTDTTKKVTDTTTNNPTTSNPQSGSFMSSAHTTSGTVSIIIGQGGKRTLSFESFKTDAGPDLKVYLSSDKSGTTKGAVELGVLKAASGTFSYEIDASVNTTSQNHVLIWCKAYSVLFGYAKL